jgi:hypothetical protein
MRHFSCKTYILVHQAGLADTAVAEDDDLESSSVLRTHFLRLSLRTFNKIFLREAISVLLIVYRWLS